MRADTREELCHVGVLKTLLIKQIIKNDEVVNVKGHRSLTLVG